MSSASSCVLPVSETIVSTTRSWLSATHFCARRNTFARPSKPSASHPGCAARARATMPGTSACGVLRTVPTMRPVAAFSTWMSSAATGRPASAMAMC